MKHDSKMHRQKVWYDTKEHNTALKNHILREVHSLNEVFKTSE